MIRILFVCKENACRSQMAEAFARIHGQGHVEAASAGSAPRGSVDATAIDVMREKGYDLSRHTSKAVAEMLSTPWDVVVGMGCGDEACAIVPSRKRVQWQIPDPAKQPVEHYRVVRDVIEQAVITLIEQSTGRELGA